MPIVNYDFPQGKIKTFCNQVGLGSIPSTQHMGSMRAARAQVSSNIYPKHISTTKERVCQYSKMQKLSLLCTWIGENFFSIACLKEKKTLHRPLDNRIPSLNRFCAAYTKLTLSLSCFLLSALSAALTASHSAAVTCSITMSALQDIQIRPRACLGNEMK